MKSKRDERLYQHLKAKSPILDHRNRSHMSPEIWQLADVRGLKGLIVELEGKATRAGGLLESIDQEYERRQTQNRRMGRAELPEMPDDLRAEQLQAQARADVIALELAFVREKLKEAEAREVAKQDDLLLKHGPIGSGKGDPLRMIDFQRVVVNPKGDLVICEPKSLFHGMLIRDYRQHIIGPFQKWLREPPTKAELELGPNRPVKDASDPKNWPARPEGF